MGFENAGFKVTVNGIDALKTFINKFKPCIKMLTYWKLDWRDVWIRNEFCFVLSSFEKFRLLAATIYVVKIHTYLYYINMVQQEQRLCIFHCFLSILSCGQCSIDCLLVWGDAIQFLCFLLQLALFLYLERELWGKTHIFFSLPPSLPLMLRRPCNIWWI